MDPPLRLGVHAISAVPWLKRSPEVDVQGQETWRLFLPTVNVQRETVAVTPEGWPPLRLKPMSTLRCDPSPRKTYWSSKETRGRSGACRQPPCRHSNLQYTM